MKNQSPSNLLIRSSLALILAAMFWTPLQAQSHMSSSSDKPMMGDKMMNSQMPMGGSRQAMMKRHQTMMEEMTAQNAELTALVLKMNSASADKKLNLLADIVTRLVEQRTAMNRRMGMMQGEMMNRSMQDMSMREQKTQKHPMMQGTDDTPKSDTEDEE